MSEEIDISKYKENLKVLAIEAWMKSEGGTWTLNKEEGVWIHDTGTTKYQVTLPSSGTANDGGEYSCRYDPNGDAPKSYPEMTTYYRQSFAELRSWIDQLLDRWVSIPNPDDIEDTVFDSSIAVRTGLAGGGVYDLKLELSNNQGLQEDLKLFEQYLGYMSGNTIATFRKNFVVKLEFTLGAIGLLAKVRDAALLAHRDIWNRARAAFLQVLNWVEEGLKQVARGETSKPIDGMNILSGTLTILSFVPGVVGKSASISNNVLSGFEKEESSDTKFWDPETIHSATSGLSQLTAALNGLSWEIEKQESLVYRSASGAVAAVWERKELFDLTPGDVVYEETNQIDFHFSELESMLTTIMPSIAQTCEQLGRLNDSCTIAPKTERASIGLTPNGAGLKIDELSGVLRDLLMALTVEVNDKILQLTQSVNNFKRLESEIIEITNNMTRELDGNIDSDPLDSPAPPSTMDGAKEATRQRSVDLLRMMSGQN